MNPTIDLATAGAPGRRPRRWHPAWTVFAVAFVTLVAAAGFRSTPGVLFDPLNAEFGWSKGDVGAAVSVNLLLIKFRQQFGLRPFAMIFLGVYAALTLAHLFVHGFGSAIAVRAASGMAGAAVSSLALYYMMQALPAKWRLKAVVLGIGVPQCATPLARLFSPDLFVVGGGVSKKAGEFLPLLEIDTEIVPATLRNKAGIVGAALEADRAARR